MVHDVGLKSGAKFLWDNSMFLDYTIKAGGKKFRVHKFVLLSVSEYFRCLFNGGMMESQKDEIEFTQFNSKQISQLIKFLYTGSDDILDDSEEEMLECAVYFQMPKVIKACTHWMILGISVSNCLHVLDIFVSLGLQDAAKKASNYITRNVEKVLKRFRTQDMSVNAIPIIQKSWQKSDWELFIYLTTWFSSDFENRKDYMEELMGQVRFSQMLPKEIEAVKDMDIYKKGKGAWKGLVRYAPRGRTLYEDLPIHQKVIADPEQNAVRGTKALYLINTNPAAEGAAFVSDKDKWKSCWKAKGLEVSGMVPFVIEVNNFLVTCSEFGKRQTWQIFDPRTLTWSKMANMPTPRDAFAMVYHDKHLYILGGTEKSTKKDKVLTDTVMIYSFETNTWRSTDIKLPVPVKNHAACVLRGSIYISGGEIATGSGTRLSNRLYCLNLSSKCWESKTPMATAKSHHPMVVMEMKKGTLMFVIDEGLNIKFYDPATDHWSDMESCTISLEFGMRILAGSPWVPGKSRLVHSGNTLYFLNLQSGETNVDASSNSTDSSDDDNDTVYDCRKWEMKARNGVAIGRVGDLPFKKGIACVLTVPKLHK